jgi:hypothetical protein
MAATAYWRPTRRQMLMFAALTLLMSGAFLLLDVALACFMLPCQHA